MSNRQSRLPPSRRRHRRECHEAREFRRHLAGPRLDVEALDRICSPVGRVRIDGVSVPLVAPHREPTDVSALDGAICRAGLATFIRPRTHADGLDHLIPATVAHMLVRELAPGIRTRVPIELVPEQTLN